MPIDPQLIRHGEFHVEEGIDRGRALLALADRPTAIFAGNDLQALGVYQAAREARLHIPEDLSVVGFDDLPVAQWVGPPLTTVRQPLVEMAVAAAELVLRLANGEAAGRRRASSWPPSWSSARAPRRPGPELRRSAPIARRPRDGRSRALESQPTTRRGATRRCSSTRSRCSAPASSATSTR